MMSDDELLAEIGDPFLVEELLSFPEIDFQ
jgi:hypothetical protein